jgi:hypothetical protein
MSNVVLTPQSRKGGGLQRTDPSRTDAFKHIHGDAKENGQGPDIRMCERMVRDPDVAVRTCNNKIMTGRHRLHTSEASDLESIRWM